MKALILNIGDEVVSGNVINTNAATISRTLENIGIYVTKTFSIRDIEKDITEVVTGFLKSEERLLITTGGLGPTHDDITKEVISKVLGLKLTLRQDATRDEYNYSDSANIDCNVKQAYFPENAKVIKNDFGTADGVYIEYNNKIFVLLVGPPYENGPMLQKVIEDLKEYGNKILYTDFILMGQSESYFENMLSPLLNRNVSISPYASNGRVRFRISCLDDENEYYQVLNQFSMIYKDYIISKTDEDINEVLVRKLKEKNLTISFGESMTGGLLAKLITDVEGASKIFNQSYVTYHTNSKTSILGVDNQIIDEFGVVSVEVTEAMAKGLRKLTNADINITVSGYAGPTGDVGRVCYTILFDNKFHNVCKVFKGSRDMIRIRAARQIFYHTFCLLRDREN